MKKKTTLPKINKETDWRTVKAKIERINDILTYKK